MRIGFSSMQQISNFLDELMSCDSRGLTPFESTLFFVLFFTGITHLGDRLLPRTVMRDEAPAELCAVWHVAE